MPWRVVGKTLSCILHYGYLTSIGFCHLWRLSLYSNGLFGPMFSKQHCGVKFYILPLVLEWLKTYRLLLKKKRMIKNHDLHSVWVFCFGLIILFIETKRVYIRLFRPNLGKNPTNDWGDWLGLNWYPKPPMIKKV